MSVEMGQPTFMQCELHGKCVDENWSDDRGVSHAGCLTPVTQRVLDELRSLRILASANDPERRGAAHRQAVGNARVVDALWALVADWQANGNSLGLGDPRVDVWHKCASQILDALDVPDA